MDSNTSNQVTLQSAKKNLRKDIRKRRRNLNVHQQKQATKKLTRQIIRSRLLLKHEHIALYLGNDGELDPSPICKLLWRFKKKTYLPVLHPITKNRLCFCTYTAKTRMRKNRFGILEPDFQRSQRIQSHHLSLVMMPLVAFDLLGNRMGMGGGFYDRSFAYKMKKQKCKPILAGIAHDFQKQNKLPIEPWDVDLDYVITDLKLYHFK